MSSFAILLTVLIASLVGTLTGFGTSTILVPILTLFYPLPETLLFVGIIHWFGDIWKMAFFKKGFNWKLILLFGIPGMIIAFLAAKIPTALPENELKKVLGIFLIAYVIFIFIKPNWKVKASNINAMLGGSLSGFFAGLFGVGGAVRGAFLSAFNLKQAVYIFTSGAIAFLIDSSRLIGYATSGTSLIQFDTLLLAISVAISLLGAYIAKGVTSKIPQGSFRTIIALALLIVGLRFMLF